MFQYDSSLTVKYSLTFGLFANTIRSLGTAKHYQFIEDVEAGRVSKILSYMDKFYFYSTKTEEVIFFFRLVVVLLSRK